MSYFVKAAVVVGLVVMAPSAFAKDYYLGAKYGAMMNEIDDYDPAQNLGIVLGYHVLDVGLGDLDVEVDYTSTTSRGDAPAPVNQWEIQTAGGYAVFRTAGMFYFKGKAGLLYEKIKSDIGSADDTGTSFGAGVGVSAGIAQFELEYTVIEQDVNYLSLTVNF